MHECDRFNAGDGAKFNISCSCGPVRQTVRDTEEVNCNSRQNNNLQDEIMQCFVKEHVNLRQSYRTMCKTKWMSAVWWLRNQNIPAESVTFFLQKKKKSGSTFLF